MQRESTLSYSELPIALSNLQLPRNFVADFGSPLCKLRSWGSSRSSSEEDKKPRQDTPVQGWLPTVRSILFPPSPPAPIFRRKVVSSSHISNLMARSVTDLPEPERSTDREIGHKTLSVASLTAKNQYA